MSRQAGGNTQFGALLLLTPLLAAASGGSLTRSNVRSVVESTTVEDAVAFYRAFEHVDVFVAEPPADATALDVRRGADAVDAVRDCGITLQEVMGLGDQADDDAREWTAGFPRSFRMADRLAGSPAASPRGRTESATDQERGVAASDAIAERAPRAFLAALAERPDTLVAKKHGEETAMRVSDRAAELADSERSAVAAWAEDLVDRGINPGTTADLLAAGLFIVMEREDVVV